MGICSRAAALLLRVTRRRPGLGFCAAARTAAASLATRVPSKKRGFCVPYSLTAFVKVKARKSSGVMRPSSTSRHAHDDCDRIHLRRGDHPAVVVETLPGAPSAARRLGAVGSGGADRRQLHLRTDTADPGVGQPRAKFTIIGGIDPALKHRYEAFLAANDVGVAGIEFISDAAGTAYTYDVNTNTNCNPDAEARAGRSGMTHWPNTWVANSPATRRHCERSEAIPCPTRFASSLRSSQ